MSDTLAYTLRLTPQARRFCDAQSKHGVDFRHFETEHELVIALAERMPVCVIVHGTKQEARELQDRLRGLESCSQLRVGAIDKFDRTNKDDDIFGTAAAVMTVFDTMRKSTTATHG
jgi:hypothetical protein